MFWKSKILRFGKYTWSEITAMVADGYIPVANADELDGIRNTTPKTMGVGSIWEGTYTTGLDKKYIQINNIDLSGFANWVAIQTFTGEYNGNELYISNCTQSGNGIYSGLFGLCQGAKFYNCIFNNFDIRGTNANNYLGAIAALIVGGYAENCKCLGGYFYSTTGRNGLGSLFGVTIGTINNCSSINTIVECGPIGSFHYIGGFIGVIGGSLVEKCWVIGSVTNTDLTIVNGTGGFVGYLGTTSDSDIIDCWANVTVNGAADVGGFIGWNRSINRFTNCMSLGTVQGTKRVGGFCGTNAGVITNCYYDSETSGQSDTGKGLPRTTAQMKEGTADSTIDGDAMYTGWDNAIWNFRTNLKYPKIRKI